MKSWALRARSQGSSSQRIMSGSTPRASARSHVSQLKAHDVDDRMRRRHEERVAAELAERPHGVDRPLGSASLAFQHEAADRRVDGSEVPVEELLRLVRLRRDVRALAQFEHSLERRRSVSPRTGDEEAIVLGRSDRLCIELAEHLGQRARSRPRPRSARPAATAQV